MEKNILESVLTALLFTVAGCTMTLFS